MKPVNIKPCAFDQCLSEFCPRVISYSLGKSYIMCSVAPFDIMTGASSQRSNSREHGQHYLQSGSGGRRGRTAELRENFEPPSTAGAERGRQTTQPEVSISLSLIVSSRVYHSWYGVEIVSCIQTIL